MTATAVSLPPRFEQLPDGSFPEVDLVVAALEGVSKHFFETNSRYGERAIDLVLPLVENAPQVLDQLHELEAFFRRMKRHGMPTETELHDIHVGLKELIEAVDK